MTRAAFIRQVVSYGQGAMSRQVMEFRADTEAEALRDAQDYIYGQKGIGRECISCWTKAPTHEFVRLADGQYVRRVDPVARLKRQKAVGLFDG